MMLQLLFAGGLVAGVGVLHLRGLIARGRFLPVYRRQEAREALAEARGALREGSRRPLGERGVQLVMKGLLSELESGLPLRGPREWVTWQEGLRVVFLRGVGGALEYDLTRAMRAAEDVERAVARIVSSYPYVM